MTYGFPLARSPFRVPSLVGLCLAVAFDAAAQSVPDPAPDPAPSPAPSSASPEPTSSEAPPRSHRRRRRRRPRRRVVATTLRTRRRARRRGGLPAARAPSVVFSARVLPVALDGGVSPAGGYRLALHPLAGARGLASTVRFSLGVEYVLRSSTHDRADPGGLLHVDLGFQRPGRHVGWFVAGTMDAGFLERFTYGRPFALGVFSMGGEVGLYARPSARVGIELAAGVGPAVFGNQWNVLAWGRVGVAFF